MPLTDQPPASAQRFDSGNRPARRKPEAMADIVIAGAVLEPRIRWIYHLSHTARDGAGDIEGVGIGIGAQEGHPVEIPGIQGYCSAL